MIPGLWSCDASPLLDALAILVRPEGLLALIGLWSLAAALKVETLERFLRSILRALLPRVLGLWALLLAAAAVIHNPTTIIQIGEYIAAAVAWATVFDAALRRRSSAAPPDDAARPNASSDSPHPYRSQKQTSARPIIATASIVVTLSSALWTAVAMTLLGTLALLVCAFVFPLSIAPASYAAFLLPAATAWTLIISMSRAQPKPETVVTPTRERAIRRFGVLGVLVLSAYATVRLAAATSEEQSVWRLPGWLWDYLFEMQTASLATDECLATRVAKYGGLSGHFAVSRLLDDPGRNADRELAHRGESSLPAITRAVRHAVAEEDMDAQMHLIGILQRSAQWPEADPLIQDWASAIPATYAQTEVKKWVVCQRKDRRSFIGLRINEQCELE